MKYLLVNFTKNHAELTELEKMARELGQCAVKDSNQLFMVGFELVRQAHMVDPDAQLRVSFNTCDISVVGSDGDVMAQLGFIKIKKELDKLTEDGAPEELSASLERRDLMKEALSEIREGKGELLVDEFCYLKDYIKWSRERLETTPEWDTDSMIESMDDAVRLMNGLLGYRSDKEE